MCSYVYMLNEVFPCRVILISPKNHSLFNKDLSTKPKKPCFELFVRGMQETPKTIQAIATALGYLLEFLKKNPLFIKTPHTLYTGFRRIEPDKTWQSAAQGLGFIVSEGAMQAAKWKNNHQLWQFECN